MAYGKNAPFGLKPWGHLISGVCDIKAATGKYTISAQSGTLNKGDPVMITPANGMYALGNYYDGSQTEIQLWNPVVTINAANAPATIAITNSGVATQPILGVFAGCRYTIGTTLYEQEHWIAGTAATSKVEAMVYDDPFIIYDVQLGTYTGAAAGTPTQFNLMPALQQQNAAWPTTGAAFGANPTIGNSSVIGSNMLLLTGSYVGVQGTLTLAGVTVNGVVGGDGTPYADNPLIANYGTALGNPLGVSTFYACPQLCVTNANPLVVDGRNEPVIARNANAPLKVHGFTPHPTNVPRAYGVALNGAGATPGNYYNTPFLNVLCTINNHVNKPGTVGVTVA
jgi:hypothetical protein